MVRYAPLVRKAGAVALAGLALCLAGCGKDEPKASGTPPAMRRLTEAQYRNIVADLFGARIVVGGHFDPLIRTNGLYAVGARSARITPSGLEQYDRMARSIAAQVVSEPNRDMLVPCKPADAAKVDEACARQFVAKVGRMVYRRPLADAEIAAGVAVAKEATERLGSFYEGIAASLAGMLVSPDFLFIVESTEDGPGGKPRLDAFAKATRLSMFLWNSAPDDALLAAAEAGDLASEKGLARQVDRMLASDHLEAGVRAFFSDMLALEEADRVEKDSIIYPAFSAAVAADAKEQTLRTIAHLLIDEGADYREIFTTRKTFMSGPLGRIYRVPVSRPDGGWMPYEFPEGDARAGLIAQVAFASLYAHPGRSSPTLRGRAIRENLLCQKVPDPPGDVDFSLFNDPNSPNRTARDRLSAHATQTACAGCHKLTDPIGLGMEKIDGAGQARTMENGAAIDTAGNLDGIPYTDAAGLGRAIHDSPAATACVVNRLYSYATGRTPSREEFPLLEYFEKGFAADKYRLTALLRSIATSDALYAVAPAEKAEKEEKS
jgi:hypothetical protein